VFQPSAQLHWTDWPLSKFHWWKPQPEFLKHLWKLQRLKSRLSRFQPEKIEQRESPVLEQSAFPPSAQLHPADWLRRKFHWWKPQPEFLIFLREFQQSKSRLSKLQPEKIPQWRQQTWSRLEPLGLELSPPGRIAKLPHWC
jgi:hypothetical protein